jgi:hypothetical protein
VANSTEALRKSARTMAIAGAAMTGAGLGIAYGLEKIVEPAMSVENELHRLRNTLDPGITGMQELAQAQKAAIEWSNKLGVSQEQLIKQLYLGTSAGFAMKDAVQSMGLASQLAVGLQGDFEQTQRTLNNAVLNFVDKSKPAAAQIQSISDVLARAASAFDYKNISEINSQLEIATPTALATATSFKDMIAALADFTRHGLTGSMAGEAFTESLQGILKMQEKLGIAMVRNKEGGLDYVASLARVRQTIIERYGSLAAMPPPVLQEFESTFGIRGMRAILIQSDELTHLRGQLDDVTGSTARFAKEMTSAPAVQFAKMWQTFRNDVAIPLGEILLPAMVQFAQYLTKMLPDWGRWIQSHADLIKTAGIIAMVSAAVLVVGGALATTISLTLYAVSGLTSFAAAIGWIVSATRIWTAAQWLLDAALSANPIGLVILGAAALAAIAYEIYAHWATLGPFFKSWGLTVLDYIAWPFRALSGIIKGAIADVKSVSAEMAAAIGRFFTGHSPIPEGPLRDLNLGHQVAQSFYPLGQITSAARAAALAVAVSMPIMAPGMAHGAGMGAAPGGGRNVVVNSSPVIHIHGAGGDADDIGKAVMDALEQHRGELLRQVDLAVANRNREEF